MSGQKKKGKQNPLKCGSKIRLFLKGGAITLSVVIFVMGIAFAVNLSEHNLNVNDIQVYGNYHLSKADVIKDININSETSLLTLELNIVSARLRSNPWIKEVSLKKQLPDTLMIRVKEATPKALLHIHGSTFLIEEEGNMLEEVRDGGMAFLPVIRSESYEKNKKGILEALQFIEALDKKGVLSSREPVEIRLNSYGPDMVMNGTVIKVGYGNYLEKLARLEELQPEVNKLGLTSYIDLRFRDRVIVKPVDDIQDKTAKAANVEGTSDRIAPDKSGQKAKPAETAKTTKPVNKSKNVKQVRKAKQ